MMSGIEEMLNYYEAFRKVLPSKLLEYKTISKPILAGLNGRSEWFVKSEIYDCAVFSPADLEHAVKKMRISELFH